MRSTTTMLAALLGLLAVAGVAAAQTEDCPECDPDVPGNDDCTYSSFDTGYVDENVTDLLDTDLCVAKPGDERGFWAVFSICITHILDACGEMLGVFASLDVFFSEDGVDVDGGIATSDGDVLDFDESPLGDLDDATWQAMPDADLPADTPPMPADLPEMQGVVFEECVQGTSLVPC